MQMLNAAAQVAALALAMAAHEAAHAGMAYSLGDPTAKLAGRLTLNPLKHIDLVGTVILPAVLLITNAGFLFGWAKPVPVDERFLKTRQDAILVSLAGVAVNLGLAMVLGFLFQILWANQWVDKAGFIPLFFLYSVIINSVLAVFNMIPMPPLDGSHVLRLALPRDLSLRYQQLQPYGIIILFILLATGALWKVMDFFIQPICKIALGDLARILYGG
ncbi:peptidase M50 [Desulfatibacillum aliphaticivorans]|uniref:Peptidase M50 n=1 Tax=Desulfatibacillum aliphaticivorans TaxID=218208 RepID=B8FEB1_DESAL|nr:site-2 protease family protein [Desulfatibacillum aliphaticivorans]ACL06892.1 peptidase M50 [Desulfatibacillum aliphaticivorans]